MDPVGSPVVQRVMSPTSALAGSGAEPAYGATDAAPDLTAEPEPSAREGDVPDPSMREGAAGADGTEPFLHGQMRAMQAPSPAAGVFELFDQVWTPEQGAPSEAMHVSEERRMMISPSTGPGGGDQAQPWVGQWNATTTTVQAGGPTVPRWMMRVGEWWSRLQPTGVRMEQRQPEMTPLPPTSSPFATPGQPGALENVAE